MDFNDRVREAKDRVVDGARKLGHNANNVAKSFVIWALDNPAHAPFNVPCAVHGNIGQRVHFLLPDKLRAAPEGLLSCGFQCLERHVLGTKDSVKGKPRKDQQGKNADGEHCRRHFFLNRTLDLKQKNPSPR